MIYAYVVVLILFCLAVGFFAGYGIAIFLYQHSKRFRGWVNNWANDSTYNS
jgi:hypothetical protein